MLFTTTSSLGRGVVEPEPQFLEGEDAVETGRLPGGVRPVARDRVDVLGTPQAELVVVACSEVTAPAAPDVRGADRER